MNDQPTQLFLRHLEALAPQCRLALRLPGEKHSYLFPDESWHFAGLDELVESEENVCNGDFGRLDILAWNRSPYSGRLLCLSKDGVVAGLEALNAALRMFWERE